MGHMCVSLVCLVNALRLCIYFHDTATALVSPAGFCKGLDPGSRALEVTVLDAASYAFAPDVTVC